MSSELTLQEQSFRLYIDLEAEELKQLCDELKDANSGQPGPEAFVKTLTALRDYTVKRVAVLKEADALFKATAAARAKLTA